MLRRIIFIIPLIFSCATLKNFKEPVLIPSATETLYGIEVTKEVLSEFTEYKNSEVTNYIKSLGQKMVKVCDRKDIPYNFYVLKTNMINAFAAPGGFIFVTTGLIKFCDNEAELASVIGHELGHVIARHSMKALQNKIGFEILSTLLFGTNQSLKREVINIAAGLLFLKHSRDQEYEADNLGTKYAFLSGYAPSAMADFLKKLAQMEKGGAFIEFLSTHPSSSKREAEVAEFAKKLSPDNSKLIMNTEKFLKIKSLIP